MAKPHSLDFNDVLKNLIDSIYNLERNAGGIYINTFSTHNTLTTFASGVKKGVGGWGGGGGGGQICFL